MLVVDRSAHWTTSMSTRFNLGRSGPVNQLVSGFRRVDGSPFSVWTNDYRPGPILDTLFAGINFWSQPIEVDLPKLLGYTTYPHHISRLRHERPITGTYDPGKDWVTYGNVLPRVSHLGPVPRDPVSNAPERPTKHTSYGGSAANADRGGGLFWTNTSISTIVGALGGYSFDYFWSRCNVVAGSPLGTVRYNPFGSEVSAGGWKLFLQLLDYIKALRDRTAHGGVISRSVIHGYATTNIDVSDVTFTEDFDSTSNKVTVEYSVTVKAYHFGSLFSIDKYKSHVEFWTEVIYPTKTSVFSFGVKAFYGVVVPKFRHYYTYIGSQTFVDIPSTYPWPRFDYEVPSTYIGYSARADFRVNRSGLTGSFNTDPLIYLPNSRRKRVDALEEFVLRHYDGIRSSSTFSASDALSEVSTSANFIESFSDLPSFLTTLEAPVKALREMSKILQGDLTRIGAFCESVAGSYLTWKYGIAPTPGDVREFTRLVSNDIRRLDKESNVVRGSFHTDLKQFISDDELKRYHLYEGELSLTSRSKVVLSGLSAISKTILEVAGSGFAPTLSNLWDLVPFSFVVDWFTGISQKIENVENSLILYMLNPRYFVHSYKVVFTPYRSSLSEYGVSSDSKPEYQVYLRNISSFIPFPQDSEFDFTQSDVMRKHGLTGLSLLVANR